MIVVSVIVMRFCNDQRRRFGDGFDRSWREAGRNRLSGHGLGCNDFRRGGIRSSRFGRSALGSDRRGCMVLVVMIVRVIVFGMFMRVTVLMTVMVMVLVIPNVMPVIMSMVVGFERRIARLFGLRRINRVCIDDIALHPLATIFAARVTMS